MADIAKVGRPNLAAVTPPIMLATVVPNMVAGAAIAVGDVCYVHTDGKGKPSIGTADNALAKAWFMALDDYELGETCKDIAWPGTFIRYANALAPGTSLYVGAAAGALADAPTTGGLTPVAKVVNAQVIYFCGSMDK